MGAILVYVFVLQLIVMSVLVKTDPDSKSSTMDEKFNLDLTIQAIDPTTEDIKPIQNVLLEYLNLSRNKTKNNQILLDLGRDENTYQDLENFQSRLIENLSNKNNENVDDVALKFNKKIKSGDETKRLKSDKHFRKERSELNYDYEQDKIINDKVYKESEDAKNSISEYKNEKLKYESVSEERTFINSENIHKNNNLKIMSHLLKNETGGAMNKLEVENTISTKSNDTLKSLGSIDVLVSSLPGMRLPAGYQNYSKTLSRSASNRTNLHSIGRTDAPMLNYIFDTYSTLNKHHHRNDRFGGPKIETPGSKVTVDTEEDAILDCKVTSLQDKLVSWLRRRPDKETPEILTIGQQAYTADIRISVDFLVPNTWRLILRKAVPSDSGVYECQLSTHPPIISRHELIVHAPIIEIVDADGDKYYERNSTLELGCRVRHIATTAIYWFHHSKNLNDDITRGGINVKTEAVSSGADSLLQVARLTANDGGKYTCSIRDGLQASINVHVLNESLAELQQTAGSSRISPSIILLTIVACGVICQTLTSTTSEPKLSHVNLNQEIDLNSNKYKALLYNFVICNVLMLFEILFVVLSSCSKFKLVPKIANSLLR